MPESTQHKLDRIRPPRVQITYDVEIGDAIVKKELPFVVGIMADLSGKPEKPLPPLRERKFIEIDRDNFNEVLASVSPQITAKAEIALAQNDVIFKLTEGFLDGLKSVPGVTTKMMDSLKDTIDRSGHRPVLSKTKFLQTLKDVLGKDVLNSLDQSLIDKAKVPTASWLQKFNGSLSGPTISSTLKFQNLDDFTPAKVINQVDVLRKLFEARQNLSDLLTKLDGNDGLAQMLQVIAQMITENAIVTDTTITPALTAEQKAPLIKANEQTALTNFTNELQTP